MNFFQFVTRGSNRFWIRASTSVIQRETTRSQLKHVARSTHLPGVYYETTHSQLKCVTKPISLFGITNLLKPVGRAVSIVQHTLSLA